MDFEFQERPVIPDHSEADLPAWRVIRSLTLYESVGTSGTGIPAHKVIDPALPGTLDHSSRWTMTASLT